MPPGLRSTELVVGFIGEGDQSLLVTRGFFEWSEKPRITNLILEAYPDCRLLSCNGTSQGPICLWVEMVMSSVGHSWPITVFPRGTAGTQGPVPGEQ